MTTTAPSGIFLVQPLLSGDAGVEQTINEMRGLVDEALHDPSIIRLAKDIVRAVPAFDDVREAEGLYNWVRANVRFTKDPVNKENLYPPAELLKIRSGDCDDISMLLATLLMAVGYPARLMTVAASQGSPEDFSHVYVEGEVPAGSGNWIAMDPARFDSEFGVAPQQITRARWWSLTDTGYGDLSGVFRFRHSGSSVRAPNLGNYPRFAGTDRVNWFNNRSWGPWRSFQTKYSPGGMGSYGRVQTMGDDVTQQDVNLVSATGKSLADIILASQGQQSYPVAAGYPQQPVAVASPLGSNIWIWLLLGVGLVAMMEKR
jgi:Transglutaminase-like superfamily